VKPPHRKSWSSKDSRVIARDDYAWRGHQSNPCLPCLPWPPPPLPKPTTPRATTVASGPGVSRRHSSASGALSPLTRPPRERCRHSFLVERHHLSPASGRHHRWPLGSPSLAHPRELSLPLKPNTWRSEVVFIAVRPWCG
jgi:hypothetical protein